MQKEKDQVVQVDKEREAINRQILDISSKREQFDKEHHKLSASISQQDKSRNSKYCAYPPGMEELVHEIESAKWRAAPPVGPIGMFVKIRDQDYALVIESFLSSSCNCFCVENDADLVALRRMIGKKRFKYPVNVIKLSQANIEDKFRADQPDQDLFTILRCVEVCVISFP